MKLDINNYRFVLVNGEDFYYTHGRYEYAVALLKFFNPNLLLRFTNKKEDVIKDTKGIYLGFEDGLKWNYFADEELNNRVNNEYKEVDNIVYPIFDMFNNRFHLTNIIENYILRSLMPTENEENYSSYSESDYFNLALAFRSFFDEDLYGDEYDWEEKFYEYVNFILRILNVYYKEECQYQKIYEACETYCDEDRIYAIFKTEEKSETHIEARLRKILENDSAAYVHDESYLPFIIFSHIEKNTWRITFTPYSLFVINEYYNKKFYIEMVGHHGGIDTAHKLIIYIVDYDEDESSIIQLANEFKERMIDNIETFLTNIISKVKYDSSCFDPYIIKHGNAIFYCIEKGLISGNTILFYESFIKTYREGKYDLSPYFEEIYKAIEKKADEIREKIKEMGKNEVKHL